MISFTETFVSNRFRKMQQLQRKQCFCNYLYNNKSVFIKRLLNQPQFLPGNWLLSQSLLVFFSFFLTAFLFPREFTNQGKKLFLFDFANFPTLVQFNGTKKCYHNKASKSWVPRTILKCPKRIILCCYYLFISLLCFPFWSDKNSSLSLTKLGQNENGRL